MSVSITPGPISSKAAGSSFFVGTYTTAESNGIYNCLLYPDGTISKIGLAAKTENPSFLAITDDKRFLLAVNEIDLGTGAGTIESYSVNVEKLELVDRQSSGGINPCFVALNSDGTVLTANYSSGNVGLLRISETGSLTAILDIQQHQGQGATGRQEGPHAHSVWFVPNSNKVIAVDLGTDSLWFSILDLEKNKLVPSDPVSLQLDPGSGPRHLVFHPDGKWLYVVNELNSTVSLIKRTESGDLLKSDSFSTLPAGYTDPNSCSDLHLSRDGKFLYVANRGHDSIAVFKASFMDGSLTLLGHKSSGGKGPRNFAFSPDENFLLIANQHSNNIVVLKRDYKTGLLKYKSQVSVFTPTCIVF